METITLDMNVTEDSREKIINNEKFAEVVVSTYWYAHGRDIPWEGDDGKKTRSFKNANVTLERVTKTYHFKYSGDSTLTEMEVSINGKKFNGEVFSCRGNKQRLVIKACVGAG